MILWKEQKKVQVENHPRVSRPTEDTLTHVCIQNEIDYDKKGIS